MKLNKLIILVFLLFFTISSWGQIVITTGAIANPNSNTLPDLLVMELFNNSPEAKSGILDFKIYNNNELKVAGTSSMITIAASENLSINQLNANQLLLPLNLRFMEQTVALGLSNGYVLPNGNYNICVKFIAQGATASEENCFPKTIKTLTAGAGIQLLYPLDNSMPPTLNPIFSWTSAGNKLFYEFKITEVLPHQISLKGSAINNPSFYTQSGLSDLNYIYPISAPKLESCKNYEWQVLAYKENVVLQEVGIKKSRQLIATSPVFRLKMKCPTRLSKQMVADNYFALSKTTSSFTYALNSSLIAFKYIEKYKTDKVKLEIKDNSGTTVITIDDFPSTSNLKTGPNYLSIDATQYAELSGYANAATGEILFLELTNKKGEKWKAKFKFE